jgi:hypothetical protein
MGFDAVDRKFKPPPIRLECCNCGATDGVETESSRTMYVYNGEPGDPDDPNRDRPYCRACAKQHHEYWNDLWAEYNHSLG